MKMENLNYCTCMHKISIDLKSKMFFHWPSGRALGLNPLGHGCISIVRISCTGGQFT